MFGDYSWLFYLVTAVLLWIARCRQALIECLSRSKLDVLHTAATAPSQTVNKIHDWSHSHEAASALSEMIRHDGASTWPPTANHNHDDWPVSLQGYKLIYLQLASRLPRSAASLDDGANRMAICKFRELFCELLRQHVDADAVSDLFEKAENDKGAVSREIKNAFYSCMAWCRHAYRWVIKCNGLIGD